METFSYLDRVILNSDPNTWGTVIRPLPDGTVLVEWDDSLGQASKMNPKDITLA